ncbi:MAG: coenzyme F420-0:L-glutamate ligase [Promethearchaeota archaeon]
MEIKPIKTPLFEPGMSIPEVILNCLEREQIKLQEGDILVIASKILATTEGRSVSLKEINPSEKAYKLAKRTEQDPRFVQLVLDNSEMILGEVLGAILTYASEIIQANAGIDRSNAGLESAILLPINTKKSAQKIRMELEKQGQIRLGIIISDSKTNPLRRGTTGFALAISGFEPIRDDRGRQDLYGYEMKVTFRALADNLACAAQVVMGESNEQTPVVLIRNAPISLTSKDHSTEMFIEPENCLYSSLLPMVIDKEKKQ